MKTKVEPNEKRYPTTKWAGNYFSESMPAGGKDPTLSPPSSTATTPQGLSSINRVRVRGEEGRWEEGRRECYQYDVCFLSIDWFPGAGQARYVV